MLRYRSIPAAVSRYGQAPKSEHMKRPALNVVGPQVQRLRMQAGLSQDELAARCGVAGWDISRGTLAKIEARVRCVSDVELWALAQVLKVDPSVLFPRDGQRVWTALSR